jgi:hypothetical protein
MQMSLCIHFLVYFYKFKKLVVCKMLLFKNFQYMLINYNKKMSAKIIQQITKFKTRHGGPVWGGRNSFSFLHLTGSF